MSESHAPVPSPIIAACVMRANRLSIDSMGRACCASCGKVLQNSHVRWISDYELNLCCPRCCSAFGTLRGTGLIHRDDLPASPDSRAGDSRDSAQKSPDSGASSDLACDVRAA